ncbi:hypothetical protein [Deinococcus sonorensis]|uniref:Uncharacterized protein n=1 Tax=Deinococcus sonorensis TaxID=309891 RepID=A0ABV8YBH1_9DEIO
MTEAPADIAKVLQRSRTAGEWLKAEHAAGQGAQFKAVDRLVDVTVRRVLAGKVTGLFGDEAGFRLRGVPARERQTLDVTFDLRAQQEQGAWFLPESARISAVALNLPAALLRQPLYGHAAVERDRATVSLLHPDALFIWALMEDLIGLLLLPLEVRGPLAQKLTREETIREFGRLDLLISALEIDLSEALRVFRYGGGWSRLNVAQRADARLEYLRALSEALDHGWAERYRVWRLRSLVDRHVQKSVRMPAKRAQVVTKELGRVLAAYFGGNWLAFLRYLGTDAHPDEAVITGLPAPRLFVTASTKVAELALQHGISPHEIERMVATLWGHRQATSPVEKRVAALRQFWAVFDTLHATQEPGMPALWGLIQEHIGSVAGNNEHVYQSDRALQLLPEALNAEIFQLWGGTSSPKFPAVIIDTELPHRSMAEAFGPALRFWNGAALTAWFLCEGPWSRTDMAGLAAYHQQDLAALTTMGVPVPASLFKELATLEKTLTPAPATPDRSIALGGLQVSFTVGNGRKRGFEQLRDAITRARRQWAEAHLETYLRQRWEEPLLAVAREHARLLAATNKPPPLRTFARPAREVVDRWFGGDFRDLYAAIGEVCPSPVTDRRGLLVGDRLVTLRRIYDLLCAEAGIQPGLRTEETAASSRHHSVERLAGEALRYIQMEGTFGRPPVKEDLNWHNRYLYLNAYGDDPDHAFSLLAQAVARSRRTDVDVQMESEEACGDASGRIVGAAESGE